MRLVHVTVVTNDAEGVRRGGGTLSITNSILWGNGLDATGTMTIAWSDVGVAAPDVTLNNGISVDPLFVDTTYQ